VPFCFPCFLQDNFVMLCPAHSSRKFPNERRSRTSSRHNSSLSRKGQQFANKGTLLRSYCKSAFNLWEYLLFKSQYFIGFHLSVFFTHSKFSEETKVQVDSKLIKVPRQVRLGHGRWNSIANGFCVVLHWILLKRYCMCFPFMCVF